jgi:NhaP-type Na+/H+ or K+/H+ antiporter
MTLLAIFVVLLFLHGLVSGRLERTVVTAPIVFVCAGAALHIASPALSGQIGSHGALLTLAEIGLVLLLFTDASRTDLRLLRDIHAVPSRLLGIGMPLTIVLGAAAALLVFPELSPWEAGILAAILAPTDAGLGQVIVNSPRVPVRIRQALNVEAGLNDGLSVPFLLFFIAMAGGGEDHGHTSFLRFVVEQLGYGTLIGLGLGLGGGALLGFAHRRGWVAHSSRQLGVVALPLLCVLACEAVGASMFIAAFVAGLAVQVGYRDAATHSVEFTEEWGQLFNLSVFFLFGLLVARNASAFGWQHAAYAAASLSVVRLLPVAAALARSGFDRSTVLFIGWFGPRGLASIVLGLVYLEQETHQPGESTIRLATMAAVFCSVFAHGLTALPGTALYARRIAALPTAAPERGAEPKQAP